MIKFTLNLQFTFAREEKKKFLKSLKDATMGVCFDFFKSPDF